MPRLLYTGEDVESAMRNGLPQLELLRESIGDLPVYLAGGAVRDLFLGGQPADLDLVVEGPVAELADRLGGEVTTHERFSTATARLGEQIVDLASARRETYEYPGALPDVEPAAIEEDLGRRDFTINAIAIAMFGEPHVIDPHRGLKDLGAGTLRILHPGSFVDDPTRALRAARYTARLDLELEPETLSLIRSTDISTVSDDRRDAELRLIAGEPSALVALRRLDDWGVLQTTPETLEVASQLEATLRESPWDQVGTRERALLALISGDRPDATRLAATSPDTPWDAVEAARGVVPEDLAIARAMGASWLDRYIRTWRSVMLEINGSDLIAAGVPEGPAVGRALKRALRAKLNDGIEGRDRELEIALSSDAEVD